MSLRPTLPLLDITKTIGVDLDITLSHHEVDLLSDADDLLKETSNQSEEQILDFIAYLDDEEPNLAAGD